MVQATVVRRRKDRRFHLRVTHERRHIVGRMKTCLSHPFKEAVGWFGHVHIKNRSFHQVEAGWCAGCELYAQWEMYVKQWQRCHHCCGSLKEFR